MGQTYTHTKRHLTPSRRALWWKQHPLPVAEVKVAHDQPQLGQWCKDVVQCVHKSFGTAINAATVVALAILCARRTQSRLQGINCHPPPQPLTNTGGEKEREKQVVREGEECTEKVLKNFKLWNCNHWCCGWSSSSLIPPKEQPNKMHLTLSLLSCYKCSTLHVTVTAQCHNHATVNTHHQ